ncbi:biotin/lipoate--protein ligase family protein [Phreatobacter stygius]|uniref:BPL/LPL catalytic domain-containing protein n=1 Tax=Phreatobacter stygius TaxID=1940610 RepID=A0A4D7BFC1_9HYPH|nr:biotin/lipoate--protein ligase family protein [Phreatobacter stygius]QCI67906.1 hypothetical protein E8M01_28950 [Phreatobacter stygius]
MSPLIAIKTPMALDLPPGFRLVPLRESGDAFGHACRTAKVEGAGTLVWVRRFDVAEFAVVLEPEEPLSLARKAFFMGMNAVADALAAHCPPERAVTFDWPDTIRFDGGLVGGGRIGWPKACAEDQTPAWLVFSSVIRIAFVDVVEPGRVPNAAALDEDGADGIGPSVIVESFARFFLRQVDLWQHDGFSRIGADYLARLAKDRPGDVRGLDGNGDLLTRGPLGQAETRRDWLGALGPVSWLDRKTGAPKL